MRNSLRAFVATTGALLLAVGCRPAPLSETDGVFEKAQESVAVQFVVVSVKNSINGQTDKNIRQCVVGFSKGFGSGAAGLVKGSYGAVVALGAALEERFYYMGSAVLGDKDAVKKLAQIGANQSQTYWNAVDKTAEAMEKSMMLFEEGMPAIKAEIINVFNTQYQGFASMPPEKQAEVICHTAGKLDFEIFALGASLGALKGAALQTATAKINAKVGQAIGKAFPRLANTRIISAMSTAVGPSSVTVGATTIESITAKNLLNSVKTSLNSEVKIGQLAKIYGKSKIDARIKPKSIKAKFRATLTEALDSTFQTVSAEPDAIPAGGKLAEFIFTNELATFIQDNQNSSVDASNKCTIQGKYADGSPVIMTGHVLSTKTDFQGRPYWHVRFPTRPKGCNWNEGYLFRYSFVEGNL